MTVQKVLIDIIKHCALPNVDVLKVTGDSAETMVQGFDADKHMFIVGHTVSPVAEFTGEFGISNFKMLNGLLGFSSYNTDTAQFKVGTREIDGIATPDQFEFKGAGSKALFKLMDKQYVPQQATIAAIPWDAEFEITKPKLAEFQEFANMYSEIDKHFKICIEGKNLVVTFGEEQSSSHSGSMTLAEGISGKLNSLLFAVDKFNLLMKLALAANSHKVKVSSKGLLGVEAESNYGSYKYYLRQTVR